MLLVGFHPATRSVQSTPTDNTQKRVWQYIEKERKKKGSTNFEKNQHDQMMCFTTSQLPATLVRHIIVHIRSLHHSHGVTKCKICFGVLTK